MISKNNFKVLILIILFTTILNSKPLENISLQLQWKHQFEFAGFYMAKEKGFYSDVGLNVEFKEFDTNTDIIQTVVSHESTYGVTYSNLISSYLNGEPVVFIANILKYSPLAIATNNSIKTPKELNNKVIMGLDKSLSNTPLLAMLKQFDIGLSDMRLIKPSFDVDDLISGKVDAMVIFTTNEIYELDKKGFKYNLFKPSTYGVEFYDINIFTSKKEALANPIRAKNFKEASLKGWQYAMDNIDETIELILKKYNTQNKTKEHLIFEAMQIKNTMLLNIFKIGAIQKEKVTLIAQSFKNLGIVKDTKINFEEFIFNSKKVSKVILTQKEKEFIKNHPNVTLGLGSSWVPYIIIDDNGKQSGYIVEVINLINEVSGLNISLYADNWHKVVSKAKNLEIDGFAISSITKDRKEDFIFTNMVSSMNKLIFTRISDRKKINSISDLKGKKLAVLKSNLLELKISKKIKNVQLQLHNNYIDAIRALSTGKADALIGEVGILYLSNKIGLPLIEPSFILEDKLNAVISIRKDYKELRTIINKSLDIITKTKLLSIQKKWFESVQTKSSKYRKLNLNSKELEYLKNIKDSGIVLNKKEKNYLKNKTIKMCIDPNWMPFEKIKNKKHIGISAEYFKLFEDKLSTKIKLIQTKTWNESLQFVKDRKCDILSLAMKNTERSKYLNFTQSYLSLPIVIATKRNVAFIDDINSLGKIEVAITKGYSLINTIKQKYKNLEVIEVKSIQEGLKKVQNDEVFAYIGTPTSISYILQREYINELKIAGKLDSRLELGIAVRNDEKVLLNIFEKLVKSIDINTRQHILNSWIAIKYEKGIDYSLIRNILIVVFIIIILFIYKQYYLNKLNKEQAIIIENEIKKSKEKDNMLYQQSKLVSIGEMISNISHQWRQPLSSLNAILINLDYDYEHEKLNKTTFNQSISEAESLTTYMSKTINDFTNFFSPTKQKELFCIKDMLENTQKMLSSSLKSQNIILELEINNDISITTYKSELIQLILIIVNNAKDAYKLLDSKNKKIIINLTQIKNDILINISDDAGGIDKSIVNKIFDPYFTTKHKSVGTGLGLYIANTIVTQSLHGSLGVITINNGSMFTIKLKNQTIS